MENQSNSNYTPKTKPQNRGTDSSAIASRLEQFYGNLTGSSPRDVKVNPQLKWVHRRISDKMFEPRGRDANNNESSPPGPKLLAQPELVEMEQEQKIKYELPQDYQGTKNCICFRPQSAYECGFCHHYFQGRLSEICEKHPSDHFLMDLRQCPYCQAQLEMIKKAPLSWDDIRKIEEAELPPDTDL